MRWGGQQVAMNVRRPSFGNTLRVPVLYAACLCGAAVALLSAVPPDVSAASRRAVPVRSAEHPAVGAIAAQRPIWSRSQAATRVQQALQLEALLGHHAVLAADMMRSRLRGDPDFAQAADAALGKNTEEMSDLVRSMLGEDAAAAFTPVWSGHVTGLFNYARGLADGDESARNEARTALTRYESDIAALFAGASRGRLPRAAAEAAMRAHVKHLLDQADAYAAKRYDDANRMYREGYAHAFGLGRTLASTLLPRADAAALNQPKVKLQSELSRLLGEHVAMLVASLRSAVTNAPDFSAAAATMDANTKELANAIDTLFGAPAARQFQSLWGEHMDGLMAYAGGVAAGDATKRDDAKRRLGLFESRLGSFLASATKNRLATPALTSAFLEHDQSLITQVDQFAAKQYTEAHETAYATYRHMVALAGQMADAIGATVATRLPRGGAQTGSGGMACIVERR
jgi:hypothetical protein